MAMVSDARGGREGEGGKEKDGRDGKCNNGNSD